MNKVLMLICAVVTVALFSCQRDHLYYETSDKVIVNLNIDWSLTGLNPNGATVIAYNHDGSLYRKFDPFSDPRHASIMLPKGKYTLVVMNDTPEELSETMTFSGFENRQSLLAQGVVAEEKTKKLIATKVEDEYCIVPPDELAVGYSREIEIDEQMVYYSYNRPVDKEIAVYPDDVTIYPEKVTSTMKIKVHVKGISYAKGTTMCFLRGTSNGYYLGRKEYSEIPASYGFILNNRTMDKDSMTDGTISAEFNCWGLIPNKEDGKAKYYLDIHFVLVDGSDYPMSIDVSDDINLSMSMSVKLNLNLDIEIPQTGPGGESGGFNTDLNPWADIIQNIQM